MEAAKAEKSREVPIQGYSPDSPHSKLEINLFNLPSLPRMRPKGSGSKLKFQGFGHNSSRGLELQGLKFQGFGHNSSDWSVGLLCAVNYLV